MAKINVYKHFIVAVGGEVPEGMSTCCPVLVTEERHLPSILVELGVFPSISEIRRNRKDLMKRLDSRSRMTLRIGRRVVDIYVFSDAQGGEKF